MLKTPCWALLQGAVVLSPTLAPLFTPCSVGLPVHLGPLLLCLPSK